MNKNINKALRELESRRDSSKREVEKQIDYVYNKIPRIKEIDEMISKTGVLIAKSVLENPENIDNSMSSIESKMNALKQEKLYLLSENNISIDYMDRKYICKKCDDTGYLKNGEKCICLKQMLISESYKMSNIENKLQSENFSTFDINIFSDEKFEGEEKTPRENIMSIVDNVESFCFNFDSKSKKSLLFYGSTGLGKSFLCNCIAKSLIDREKTVIYQTAFKIIEIVENHRFKKENNSFSTTDYDMLFESDLLIIDDLGTELSNSFTTTEFFNIINSRMLNEKKTVISTNLEPLQISQIYTSRFFSRLLSNFEIHHFFGKDLRWERFK